MQTNMYTQVWTGGYPEQGGRTLAWPGWKHPNIAVKVDRHDSKQAGSKNVV